MRDQARTGVILAAGLGSRLSGGGQAILKPLTKIGGVALLHRAVAGLARAGCARVVVVVGYRKDDVIASFAGQDFGVEIVFADNPLYRLKNGVSVLAARPHLVGDIFVLAMADHVVGDEVMDIARAWTPDPGTAALLVDYKLDSIFDMDDATKVLARDGRIAKIGKQIADYNCVDCGVFVCSTALMEAIDGVYQATGDASLSDGVQALAARGAMHAVDIGAGFWQDVDTADMLRHAEAELARRALGSAKKAPS